MIATAICTKGMVLYSGQVIFRVGTRYPVSFYEDRTRYYVNPVAEDAVPRLWVPDVSLPAYIFSRHFAMLDEYRESRISGVISE